MIKIYKVRERHQYDTLNPKYVVIILHPKLGFQRTHQDIFKYPNFELIETEEGRVSG